MSDESLKVQTVQIADLMPDPQNVRTHNTKNLDAIRKSLESFGQRKPIVVARGNAGQMIVIAGNGTLDAAKSLGWSSVSVVELPADWDADKARAYAIADNRTGELAEWNRIELANALVDLDAVGWDASVLGFESLHPPTTDLADAFAGLPDGDRNDATQMTFTLTLGQAEIVKQALAIAVKSAPGEADTGNANGNGNALSLIVREWLDGNR